MDKSEYEKYQSYGLVEYAADTRKFAAYVEYHANNRLITEGLTLFSVLLDHFVNTNQENKGRLLKIKELIAILLAYSRFDGSKAQIIAKWKFEIPLMKSVFSFAAAYSNKKLGGIGQKDIVKLFDFWVSTLLCENATITVMTAAETSKAERSVHEFFFAETRMLVDQSNEVDEKIYAGILCAKKSIVEQSLDIPQVIERLAKMCEQYGKYTTNFELIEATKKILEFFPLLKQISMYPSTPPTFMERFKIHSSLSVAEPMLMEEQKLTIMQLPSITKTLNYDDVKHILLRSNQTTKDLEYCRAKLQDIITTDSVEHEVYFWLMLVTVKEKSMEKAKGLQRAFFDSLAEAVSEFGIPLVPLWIVLLGQMTEFVESKWLLLQTIEKIEKMLSNEKSNTLAKSVTKFTYNLILLEEKLRKGEKTKEELTELLYSCYQFIRTSYFDFDLKKQQANFDAVFLFAKSLRSINLCKTLKGLAIETINMVKLRLGKLVVPEAIMVEQITIQEPNINNYNVGLSMNEMSFLNELLAKKDLQIDHVQFKELESNLLKLVLKICRIEANLSEDKTSIHKSIKADTLAEMGHIRYLQKKYKKAILNYVEAMNRSVWDVDTTSISKLKRLKKLTNHDLICYRMALSLFIQQKYMRVAIVLQLVNKTPYSTIFSILNQIDIKKESSRCRELFEYIYKMPIIEFLICMYKEKGNVKEEEELMRILENAELFQAHPKHKKKQLKQNVQVSIFMEMHRYFNKAEDTENTSTEMKQ